MAEFATEQQECQQYLNLAEFATEQQECQQYLGIENIISRPKPEP